MEQPTKRQIMAQTFIGKPCKRGHRQKYLSNGNCVQCNIMLEEKRRGKRNNYTGMNIEAETDYKASVQLGNRILTSQWSAIV